MEKKTECELKRGTELFIRIGNENMTGGHWKEKLRKFNNFFVFFILIKLTVFFHPTRYLSVDPPAASPSFFLVVTTFNSPNALQ